MSRLTMFEEDTAPAETTDDDNSVSDEGRESNGSSWGHIGSLLVKVGVILGSVIVVGLIVLALWWLLFAPSPSDNVVEASSIIEDDIESTLSSAEAYRISNAEGDSGGYESVLTVETPENTCKVFRAVSGGGYQAVESEGPIDISYLRLQDENYEHVHLSDGGSEAFEYYRSGEHLKQGVAVNLRVGQQSLDNSRSVNIAGQYGSGNNAVDESFCFQ